MRRRDVASRVRWALLLGLVGALAGCGGADSQSGQRPKRTTSQFEAFCQQNVGACDNPGAASDTSVITPAVSARGWKKRACPLHVLDPGAHAPEGVVRALRSAVPRLIRVSAYGHDSKLAPENTGVLDIRPLTNPYVDLPGLSTLRSFSSYYERAARRLCGRVVSTRSWGAILTFPEAQGIALSFRVILFARTPKGWKAWYPAAKQ